MRSQIAIASAWRDSMLFQYHIQKELLNIDAESTCWRLMTVIIQLLQVEHAGTKIAKHAVGNSTGVKQSNGKNVGRAVGAESRAHDGYRWWRV